MPFPRWVMVKKGFSDKFWRNFLSFHSFFAVFFERNGNHFSVFLSSNRNTWEKFGRTRKSYENSCLQLMFPQHFLFSQTVTHVSVYREIVFCFLGTNEADLFAVPIVLTMIMQTRSSTHEYAWIYIADVFTLVTPLLQQRKWTSFYSDVYYNDDILLSSTEETFNFCIQSCPCHFFVPCTIQ